MNRQTAYDLGREDALRGDLNHEDSIPDDLYAYYGRGVRAGMLQAAEERGSKPLPDAQSGS